VSQSHPAANKGSRGWENLLPSYLPDKPKAAAARGPGREFSPLVLADRLILLAQEADRAGYRRSASSLIVAAHAVLDEDAPVTDD